MIICNLRIWHVKYDTGLNIKYFHYVKLNLNLLRFIKRDKCLEKTRLFRNCGKFDISKWSVGRSYLASSLLHMCLLQHIVLLVTLSVRRVVLSIKSGKMWANLAVWMKCSFCLCQVSPLNHQVVTQAISHTSCQLEAVWPIQQLISWTLWQSSSWQFRFPSSSHLFF